jgi:hypothetical protein
VTSLLDDLLLMRYPGLKYIQVFDGILRRAEELEQANQKDIADLMRSRVRGFGQGAGPLRRWDPNPNKAGQGR